uniref:Uncharacterized protein n=1 Tax=viral metagenome TaxID=1070528 RepID=A0A6H1ZH00_9ZZZZ
MKTLMVSFDCGIHYEPFMKSESIDELIKRTEKVEDPHEDISYTRWYIEDEGGQADKNNLCPIHREIKELLIKLSRLNEGG